MMNKIRRAYAAWLIRKGVVALFTREIPRRYRIPGLFSRNVYLGVVLEVTSQKFNSQEFKKITEMANELSDAIYAGLREGVRGTDEEGADE